MTTETPNTYYTKEMRYPRAGGYKAFIQPLIDASEIRLQHQVVAIDPAQRTALCPWRGSAVPAADQHPAAAGAGAPEQCRAGCRGAAAAGLKASAIDLVSVGFRRPVTEDLWFYIYDEDILAARAYSPWSSRPTMCRPAAVRCSLKSIAVANSRATRRSRCWKIPAPHWSSWA
jgi:protoporphyrinogen oxidase